MTRAALLRDAAGFTLAAAVAIAVAALRLDASAVEALALVAVAALAAWIAAQDLADQTIPDGAVAGLAALGTALRLAEASAFGLPWSDVALLLALDVGLSGGALFLLRELWYRRTGADGLGFGDVKLAAAGGVLVGGFGFSVALLAASLAGIAWVAARHGLTQARAAGHRLAFGAFLAPALAAAYLAGRLGWLPGAGG